jgi:hypothetical protein
MSKKRLGQKHTLKVGPTRRDVIASAAIMAAGSLAIGTSAPAKATTAEQAILSILHHREAASQIGYAALETLPAFRNQPLLLADILGDLGLDQESVLRLDQAEIGARLIQRIHDEFASQRTVMLDGWILSLTETRLCALAALDNA